MLRNKQSLFAVLTLMLCTAALAQFGRSTPGRRPHKSSPYIARFIQGPDGGLLLQLLTRKQYNHGGYKIAFKKTVTDKQITIDIDGISAPGGIHTQAFAPARASIPLPVEKGSYTITVKDKDISSNLTYTVNEGAILLTSAEEDPLFGRLKLNYNLLPENVFSVMIVKETDSREKDLTQDILKSVSALPGVEKWEPKRGPYLCKHWQYPHRFLTYFRMKPELDWAALEKFVKGYAEQSHMAITIRDPKEGRQLRNN